MLPCSISSIQGSDRCLSFEGLPEEAFEHLANLNYLYLANNKVRAAAGGFVHFLLEGGALWGWWCRSTHKPAPGAQDMEEWEASGRQPETKASGVEESGGGKSRVVTVGSLGTMGALGVGEGTLWAKGQHAGEHKDTHLLRVAGPGPDPALLSELSW